MSVHRPHSLITSLWAALLVCVAGCSSEVAQKTELVVAVHAGQALTQRIDGLEFVVRDQAMRIELERPLPYALTLGAVSEASEGGTLTIRARAGNELVLERVADLRFVKGERRIWHVWLNDACLAVSCEGGQACDNCGECAPTTVPESALEPLSDGEPDLSVWAGPVCGANPAGDGSPHAMVDGGMDGGPGAPPEAGSDAGPRDGAPVDVPDGSEAGTGPLGLSAPPIAAAGYCEAVRVELLDASLRVGGNVSLSVGEGGSLHASADCSDAPLSNLTLAPGADGGTVYFKGALAAGALRREVSVGAMLGGQSATAQLEVRLPLREIALGAKHGCVVAEDEHIYCWGDGTQSAQGQDDAGGTIQPLPARVVRPRSITTGSRTQSLVAANYHTCAVVDGGAFCFGANGWGQLGTGGLIGSTVPVPVNGLGSGVTVIAAFAQTTCAVHNGAAKCWGDNGAGQVLSGAASSVLTPTQVPGLATGVSDVCAGLDYACALQDDHVFCWGDGSLGQLGHGVLADATQPVEVQGFDGLTTGTSVVDLSCGDQFACARVASGEVRCWGANQYYPVYSASGADSATPVTISDLTNITAMGLGSTHACMTNGDSVRCFGRNRAGQLGTGMTSPSVAPPGENVALAGPISALTSNVDSFDTPASCAIARGVGRCWGGNPRGQLGASPDLLPALRPTRAQAASGLVFTDVAVQSSVQGTHTCAIADGKVHCWGLALYGPLGNGTENVWDSVLDAVQVSGVSGATEVVSGGSWNSCAIAADLDGRRRLFCWGSYLTQPEWSKAAYEMPVSEATAYEVEDVCMGAIHACAVVSGDPNASVYCWGRNPSGQLGNGLSGDDARTSPVVAIRAGADGGVAAGPATRVDCAGDLTCAVVDGKVECWGSFEAAFLSASPQAVPMAGASAANPVVEVAVQIGRVCGLLQDGKIACADWPLTTSSQVAGSNYTAIEAGGWNVCAKKADGLWCWGDNSMGQVGNGMQSDTLSTPTKVQGLGAGVSAFSTGSAVEPVTCAVEAGALYCWGSNVFRAIGGDAPWFVTTARALGTLGL